MPGDGDGALASASMPGDGDGALVSASSDNSSEAVQSDVVTRKFTWEELSKLNQRHNAHVAVRGKVYDVSGFIEKHPGGVNQIMLGAGRDATVVFESYHNYNVTKVLEKYYVGELISNEMPVFPKPSEFHKTLRERVEKYFKENNIDPKISYWMFFRYVVIFMMAMLCWLGMMVFHDSLVLGVPVAAAWGFLSALVAMTSIHDASHFAITHKPWVWWALGSLHDFYQGASLYVWTNQHILGHHPFTNIDGVDPDIVTANPNVPDIRRIKWNQKWVPRHFYQHIYMPILYCILGIKTRLQDFYVLYQMKNCTIRMNGLSKLQLFIFFAGKLTHCIYRFVIPSFFISWPILLLYNIIGEIVGSYWLALLFQTSHVLGEVEWPKPDPKDMMVQKDWAEMQVATSQDYATDSWFWNVFTGALNHQTAHHLFPSIIQSHYPHITPIVRQTCQEFGIKYHYVDTMWEALRRHLNHLKQLGQTKESKTD